MFFFKFWERNLPEAKRLEIENLVLPRNKQRLIRYAIGNAPAEFSDVETNTDKSTLMLLIL